MTIYLSNKHNQTIYVPKKIIKKSYTIITLILTSPSFIKLSTRDGLPQWVCYECAMMLHKYHKFKEKCLQGQHVLKQVCLRGKVST